MKRILKASAAFALATTLIFSGAGMASATDEATPAPEVSAEVQAPAETSTVEEAAVTNPVAAPAPAEAVEAPVVETAPAEPQAKVVTTDAQPQAPPVVAKKPQETYVTALWEGTDVQWPKGGQTLVGSVKHNDKALNKGWINYQELKPCTVYQGDLYVDDKITKALLKGGKLYGPGNPTESWPGGVYQSAYSVVFTTPCPPVVVPPRHNANGESFCAAASVTLYNQEYKGEVSQTASFVVLVDGKFYGAYAVESGKSQTLQFTFPEDSGNHSIIVRTGSAQGDEFVYRQDVLNTDCIPPKPETKIEFSTWVDGEFDCAATEVPQTRTKSVTEFSLVGNEWVADEPVVTTENQTRPLTEEEQETADIECAGPQPENKVTRTEWVKGEYVCGDTTVQLTRTETVTEYVREGAEWVEGESIDNFQTETRDLTAEEIAELECAVVVPPTETPKPTPAPSVTPAPEASGLAATGGELPVIITVGAVLALVIGGAVILLSRRKKVDEVTESVDAE